MSLLFLLIGCGAEDPVEEETPQTTELPSSYEYTPDEGSEATLDLASLEDSIDTLFAELLDLNAAPAILSYEVAMDASDAGCPAFYEQDGNTFWYATCASGSGGEYDGYAFYTLYDDYNLFGDGTPWDAIVLSGAADVMEPDGDRYHLGGTAYFGESHNADTDLYISVTTGSFFAEGPEVADTWVTTGSSPSLTLYGAQYPAYGINIMLMSGSTAVTSGDLSAVQLNDLIMYTPSPGIYPCAEPSGSMGVRDAAGNWYTIEFDVVAEGDTYTAPEGTCDGCATVFHEGDALGEVCIDPTPVIDWEITPW
ncbi:MAG: hypothetical protein ACI8RZ_002521 [Myxococcota bacterium]|jgi:hypothetical protein